MVINVALHMITFFNSIELIASLQDTQTEEIGTIIEPETISFSFNTIGWKSLGIFLVIATISLLIKWAIRYHKNTYRRAADNVLAQIEKKFSLEKDRACLNDSLILLKQVAITAFGRANVAELSGKAWLKFLESKAKNTPFLKYEDDILNSLYLKNELNEHTTLAVLALTKKWINTHA